MTSEAHPVDQLPAYLAGSLARQERWRLERHFGTCLSCRSSLSEWTQIQDAMTLAPRVLAAPRGEELISRIGAALDERPRWEPPACRLRLLPILVLAQVPLVRRRLWLGSALVMALGTVVAASARSATSSALVIALLAPLVAALGVAVLHAPACDAGLEVVLATPTSPGMVISARLLLVVGYDFGLTLAASVIVAVTGRSSIALLGLIDHWLGPLLLLACVSLVLSVLFRASTAVSVTFVLWGLRVLAGSNAGGILLDHRVSEVVKAFWSTSWITVAAALACVPFAYVLARPRHRRLV